MQSALVASHDTVSPETDEAARFFFEAELMLVKTDIPED